MVGLAHQRDYRYLYTFYRRDGLTIAVTLVSVTTGQTQASLTGDLGEGVRLA